MPKINQPQRRIEPTSELVTAAHAHRVAVGWLVAREAGLDHDATGSPFGGQSMEKWRNTKNLPGMLKAFTHQAKLIYRVRALCLQLHDHPSASVCGGAEQWWQRILEEDILAAIVAAVGPEVLPEMAGIKPPTTPITLWWMRRGVNPVNAKRRPATWALIEAVQARVYRWRPEITKPSEDVSLPVTAVNGEMPLVRRKKVLKEITGRIEGRIPHTTIELWTDWKMMLDAWQFTAKVENQNPKSRPLTSANPERYDQVAWIINEAVMPDWWANIDRIHGGLEDISQNKLSDSSASAPVKTFSEVAPANPYTEQDLGTRINSSHKKRAVPKCQPGTTLGLSVNETSSSRKTAMSDSNTLSGVES